MKKYAVLVAGGIGSRMNSDIPKQFLLIKGKPVLYYTIITFFKAFNEIEIILVLPQEHLEAGKEIISTYFSEKNITVTTGGNTRFHSVKNGLQFVTEDSVVFVHDAVRCLFTEALIHRCYEAAIEKGAVIPVADVKDSIRVVDVVNNKAVDRTTIKLVQTPQVFLSEIILTSYDVAYSDSFTDDATVVEASGHKIHLIEGENNNLKITLPIDILIAEKIMEG